LRDRPPLDAERTETPHATARRVERIAVIDPPRSRKATEVRDLQSSSGMQTASVDVEPSVATAAAIFRRLFVPVDFSMSSHRAVGVALDLQRTYGSAICIFHWVASSGSDDWLGGIGSPAVAGDWVAETKERLHRFLDNIAPGAAARVEINARFGETIPSIRRAAEDWNASLVIAAAGVHTELLRSPAEHLIHHFEVPTLIIPADTRSKAKG
jgi:nucleotide-binding universal stress UspA family protein